MTTWLALARILVELFGPWLLKALDERLHTAAADLERTEGAAAPADRAAVNQLFETAKGKLWFWQAGKWAILNRCQKIAVRRAADVVSAAKGIGSQPYLTRDEQQELAELV